MSVPNLRSVPFFASLRRLKTVTLIHSYTIENRNIPNRLLASRGFWKFSTLSILLDYQQTIVIIWASCLFQKFKELPTFEPSSKILQKIKSYITKGYWMLYEIGIYSLFKIGLVIFPQLWWKERLFIEQLMKSATWAVWCRKLMGPHGRGWWNSPHLMSTTLVVRVFRCGLGRWAEY